MSTLQDAIDKQAQRKAEAIARDKTAFLTDLKYQIALDQQTLDHINHCITQYHKAEIAERIHSRLIDLAR